MLRRRLHHALLVLVTAGLTLPLVPSQAQASRGADDPDFHRPDVGVCHPLTANQASKVADRSTPVSCEEQHTSRTIAVVTVEEPITSPDDLAELASSTCWPAFHQALGSTADARARTAYSWVWFLPNRYEREERGARWLRCDLVLRGGYRLLPLPTDDVPALAPGEVPDDVARCLTGRKYLTACARQHQFRATGAVRISAPLPSQTRLERLAQRRCPALTKGDDWTWTAPGADAYRGGNTRLICYTRTAT